MTISQVKNTAVGKCLVNLLIADYIDSLRVKVKANPQAKPTHHPLISGDYIH